MKRLISRLLMLGVAALGITAAQAEPNAAPAAAPAPAAKSGGVALSETAQPKAGMRNSLESWLKDLRRRVAKTRAHQNQLVAVAAVRGAETSDAPPLYWKGKKASGPVDAKELDQFEKAVEAAVSGQPDAKSQLEAFISAYPKSTLSADAKAAVQKMDAAATAP